MAEPSQVSGSHVVVLACCLVACPALRNVAPRALGSGREVALARRRPTYEALMKRLDQKQPLQSGPAAQDGKFATPGMP